MKTIFTLTMFAVIAAVTAFGSESAPPLEGHLPEISSEWIRRTDEGRKGAYSWVNFDHKSAPGDTLGFVVWKVSPATKVTDSAVNQASIEMFADNGQANFGLPKRGEPIGDVVRHRVVSIDIDSAGTRREMEALEYTYIFNKPNGSATMAHGYCVVVGTHVVFVQHTSPKAISSDVAFEMASDVVSRHLQLTGKPHAISKGKIRKSNG